MPKCIESSCDRLQAATNPAFACYDVNCFAFEVCVAVLEAHSVDSLRWWRVEEDFQKIELNSLLELIRGLVILDLESQILLIVLSKSNVGDKLDGLLRLSFQAFRIHLQAFDDFICFHRRRHFTLNDDAVFVLLGNFAPLV